MRITCECCGRQIVHRTTYQGSDQYVVYGPATILWPGQYACSECAGELDQDGLYPEERAEAERVARILAMRIHFD